MSKGGDTTTTNTTGDLPAYIKPYVTDLLGRAQTMSNQPYQTYGNQRLANFSGDTQNAFQMIRNQAAAGSPQLQQAMNAALGIAGYQANGFNSGNVGTGTYGGNMTTPQTMSTAQNVGTQNYGGLSATPIMQSTAQQINTQNYGGLTPTTTTMSNAGNVGTSTFGGYGASQTGTGQFNFRGIPGADLQSYMNPYINSVLDVQQGRATRAFGEQEASRNAAAVKAGAFGGDRRFVQDSLAQRDLNEQMQAIEAEGLSSAFNQATSLFNTDEARRLQAYEGDEGRRLTAGMSDRDRALSAYQSDAARRLEADTGNASRSLAAQEAYAGRQLEAGTADRDRALQAFTTDQARRLEADRMNAANSLSASEAFADRSFQGATTDRNRALEAFTSDQARRLQADVGNADRNLSAQESAAARALQGGLADRDRMLAAYEGDQARGLQAGISNADRNLQAQMASEEARRLGAGMGLDAALGAGQLSQMYQDAQMRNAEALSGVGSKIQQREQAGLDMAYKDFTNQRDWPQQQLSLYSQLLSGTPVTPTSTTSTTEPAPDFLSQLLGAGTSLLGLGNLFGGK